MIVVRNVFRIRFGKMREAVALWKEGLPMLEGGDAATGYRLLTDVTGPSYTLVMEGSYASLAEFERQASEMMKTEAWKGWYARFVPLAESAHREIYGVVA